MTDGKQVALFGLLLLAAAWALLSGGCAARPPAALVAGYCVVHHYDGCPTRVTAPCPGGHVVYTGVLVGAVAAEECFYGKAARSL